MKSGEKQGAEAWLAAFRARERFTICFRGERELCGGAMFSKPANNRPKRCQVDVVEIDASGAEPLQQIQQMIWRALDRNRGEVFRVGQLIIAERFFRSEAEQKSQMLTARRCRGKPITHAPPQIRRGEKLNTEC